MIPYVEELETATPHIPVRPLDKKIVPELGWDFKLHPWKVKKIKGGADDFITDDEEQVDDEADYSDSKKAKKGKAKQKATGKPKLSAAAVRSANLAMYPDFEHVAYPDVEEYDSGRKSIYQFWANKEPVSADKSVYAKMISASCYDLRGKSGGTTSPAATYMTYVCILEAHAIGIYRQHHLDELQLGGIRKDLNSILAPFLKVNQIKAGSAASQSLHSYPWVDKLVWDDKNPTLSATPRDAIHWLQSHDEDSKPKRALREIQRLICGVLKNPLARAHNVPSSEPLVVNEGVYQAAMVFADVRSIVLDITMVC